VTNGTAGLLNLRRAPLTTTRGVLASGLVGWGVYWEIAAVGLVFEVAMCAAMGTLEVASV
jgi:hypothetical protein